MLSENIGHIFQFNKQWLDSSEFEHVYKELASSVYEVIRIMDGIPLFFEEHFERLIHSARLLNHKLELSAQQLHDDIVQIAIQNNLKNNNVKLVINNLGEKQFNEYLFLIHSNYPAPELYKNGVTTMTYHASRNNPNAKIIHQQMRDKINHQLKETGHYEALLVNDSNHVTEGSRSNLFFLKTDAEYPNGAVYTSPAADVLIGITRKKVVSLCKTNGIEVVEKAIPKDKISSFDACFISGTSPKLLPVRNIDGHAYSTTDPLLQRIMELYQSEIQTYLNEHGYRSKIEL